MASLAQVPRDGKRRIATEIHDNLVARSTSGLPDSIDDEWHENVHDEKN